MIFRGFLYSHSQQLFGQSVYIYMYHLSMYSYKHRHVSHISSSVPVLTKSYRAQISVDVVIRNLVRSIVVLQKNEKGGKNVWNIHVEKHVVYVGIYTLENIFRALFRC